jgi:hypothetical protein
MKAARASRGARATPRHRVKEIAHHVRLTVSANAARNPQNLSTSIMITAQARFGDGSADAAILPVMT